MTFQMNPDKIGTYEVAAVCYSLCFTGYRSHQQSVPLRGSEMGPCAPCVVAATLGELQFDVSAAERLCLLIGRGHGGATARNWRDVLAAIRGWMLGRGLASILSIVTGNQDYIIKSHVDLIKAKLESCWAEIQAP